MQNLDVGDLSPIFMAGVVGVLLITILLLVFEQVMLLVNRIMYSERSQLSISATHHGIIFFGVCEMRLKPNQRVLLTIIALTAAGTPGQFDGEPEWSSSDEDVVHLEPVPGDPLSVWAYSRAPGSASVSFVADADLDEGEIREISADIDFTVVGEEVTVVEIQAGSPEDVPA